LDLEFLRLFFMRSQKIRTPIEAPAIVVATAIPPVAAEERPPEDGQSVAIALEVQVDGCEGLKAVVNDTVPSPVIVIVETLSGTSDVGILVVVNDSTVVESEVTATVVILSDC
jgi:hypothetical protein